MPYKGSFAAGSALVITYTSFATNAGSALVLAGCAAFDGGTNGQGAVAAPGGFTTLNLSCSQPGIFKVDVDMAEENDSGELEVRVNGAAQDKGRIVGDTLWRYSVI